MPNRQKWVLFEYSSMIICFCIFRAPASARYGQVIITIHIVLHTKFKQNWLLLFIVAQIRALLANAFRSASHNLHCWRRYIFRNALSLSSHSSPKSLRCCHWLWPDFDTREISKQSSWSQQTAWVIFPNINM
jgi:hypothetical protein